MGMDESCRGLEAHGPAFAQVDDRRLDRGIRLLDLVEKEREAGREAP